MVTSGTYRKAPIFNSKRRLDFLRNSLFAAATDQNVALQAWAIFPNHYHFVATLEDPGKLREMLRGLHSGLAREVNRADDAPGRKVWFQFWESRITFERSYFARLRYVHQNAVHHRLVRVASRYEWCSARWFERKATPALPNTVLTFPCDSLAVNDEFSVEAQSYLCQ